jgi:hypothetical protein
MAGLEELYPNGGLFGRDLNVGFQRNGSGLD